MYTDFYEDFIKSQLHNVQPDVADQIANANGWRMGGGWDLLKADVNCYVHVFGRDVGGYLYKSVGEERKKTWKRTSAAWIYHGKNGDSLKERGGGRGKGVNRRF